MPRTYDDIGIPERIARFLPPVKEFIIQMDDCAIDNPGKDGIDYDRIERVTRQIERVLDKEIPVERSIMVEDYLEFIDDVKSGDNGLGLSWSYTRGRVVESFGCRGDRYEVTMSALVLTPETINYFHTYCNDQSDADFNPDELMSLENGGKVLLEEIHVHDTETGENFTVEIGQEVTISEEY